MTLAGIAVATPASWFEVDLAPATRRASIARLVQERAADAPVDRGQLQGLIEHLATDAADRGAVYAAGYSDVLEGLPVAASLIVTLVNSRPTGPGDSAPENAALVEGLRIHLAGDGAEVATLPTGAGRAVRARRRRRAPVPGTDGSVEAAIDSSDYFLPFPDGARIALLSFSTPTLGLAEPFRELFDAIAGTARWT